MKLNRKSLLIVLLFLFAAVIIWALPVSGNVFVMLDEPERPWPRLYLEPETPRPGERATLVVQDTTPWVHVRLLVDDESEARFTSARQTPLGWEWQWRFTVPQTDAYQLVLYHDCDRGCREWARKTVNNAVNVNRYPAQQRPTKLCAVFPNPERNWQGRSVWVVELTYALQADSAYWGVDDLAQRVHTAVVRGQRVLLRIEYDQNQSLPPPDDEAALAAYLDFVRRLAHDDRFRDVYALVIGSGYNSLEHNAQAPDNPVTPAWYARLFNGYGIDPGDMDNVLAVVRAENPNLRVLVGAVQPWVVDMEGARPYTIDAPWLNYFHTLVTLLDEAAREREEAGLALAAPDGFAVHAPGNPDSPKMETRLPALEPQTDLISTHWHGAQLGFRVYREWLDIINGADSSRGKPVFITATNTFGADNTGPPSHNYPDDWLIFALAEINRQPQVQSLCWFADYFPFSDQWQAFSLTNPQGNMAAAAVDFEVLLFGE